MAKALKRMLTDGLESALADASGLLILDPGPMTVENAMAFRADLRTKAGGAKLRVLHNRTALIALKRRWFDGQDPGLEPLLSGSSAIAYGGAGPISIARVVRDWKRRWKPLAIKGAIADGELVSASDADGLADMPDLPALRSMLLGAMQGSARGIAVSMAGVYGGIARCIQARIDAAGPAEGEPVVADEAEAVA